jgi:hypothetical protein
VTGKWVDASSLPEVADRRASGAGGDGGDFFSGLGFVDNRKQEQAPESLLPEVAQEMPQAEPEQIVSINRPRRNSKYSIDLPVAEAIQTDASPQEENTLIQTSASASQVERIFHKFDPETQLQVASSALKVRTIGSVCRFQGVAPASGCPAEATNGCVDHIPCTLACPKGGFFRWRCLGPQIMSPNSVTAPPAPEVFVPPPSHESTDDYVHDLASRIGSAIQNNDYTGLARAILQAQSAPGASAAANAHLALAVSHLSQMQQSTLPASDEDISSL